MYNVVESKLIRETISVTEPVEDAEYGIPPGNLNLDPYVKLPEVAGWFIFRFIVCPGCMLIGSRYVVVDDARVNSKKFPRDKSIDAVDDAIEITLIFPWTLPVIVSDPVIKADPVNGNGLVLAIVELPVKSPKLVNTSAKP